MNKNIYSQEVTNLHTHSFYCGHGTGTIMQYTKEALQSGLSLLGFSEHCPVEDDRWKKSRMKQEQIPLYELDCQEAKHRYHGKLHILTGYECDYLRQYDSYYASVKDRVDFLICAIHDLSKDLDQEYSVFWNRLSKKDLAIYADMYCSALSSG
ncbi:MAG: PHP domain-containing protein, partial [Spirochaetia bacterium]|nr:PHP domain-containing protein [Spirochaetia bacterium]